MKRMTDPENAAPVVICDPNPIVAEMREFVEDLWTFYDMAMAVYKNPRLSEAQRKKVCNAMKKALSVAFVYMKSLREESAEELTAREDAIAEEMDKLDEQMRAKLDEVEGELLCAQLHRLDLLPEKILLPITAEC